MGDTSKFTEAQKKAVESLLGWELFSVHSNGDVTVKVGGEMYRYTKEGVLVDRWGGDRPSISGASYGKHPIQASLSSELTAELKKKPSQPEKKYTSKPAPYVPFSSKTICQEEPFCCEPREIKGVFWDADHTIWNMPGTAASVTGPLKKIDDNTVVELSKNPSFGHPVKEPEDEAGYELTEAEEGLLEGLSEKERAFLLLELRKEHGKVSKPAKHDESHPQEYVRTTIKLDPTFRQTLDELEKRGIKSSIISLNTPGSVKRILKEFGLDHRFTEIRDSYENKGKVFKELTRKQGMCTCNGMFVDDNRSNTDPVHEKCGLAIQIGKGKDIEQDIEILKYIKAST
jgi:FMN phosphatase YigB (HAD superfamily)